jgi:Tol biopolymer transport system component/DNA-binding winged helix-turn-helix (wHTH) protein
MSLETRSPVGLRFGTFEVDLRAGELRKQGVRIKLQEQPFHVLTVLLQSPGEVVTRDELRSQIWPADTFVDFDNSLNTSINKLREALGDSAESPRFIETLPRRGYRFITPVMSSIGKAPAVSDLSIAAPKAVASKERRGWRHLRWLVLLGLSVALAIMALAFWSRSHLAGPKVLNYTALTSDREPKFDPLVTDGTRLYFMTRKKAGWTISEVSTAGGETAELPSHFDDIQLADISPNGSELLIGQFNSGEDVPIYILPLPAGLPRRVGDILAHDASWSPSGEQIVYARGNELYIAKPDGSQSRRPLVTLPGRAECPSWSPDGRLIRFIIGDENAWSSSLWEVASDGSRLHAMLPGWSNPPAEGCGEWTLDGNYFVFESQKGENPSSLWAIQDKSGFLGKRKPQPIQLTTGPMEMFAPLPSRDGKRLFAIGVAKLGELVRYDARSEQFLPFLSGISAIHLDFSKDGQWVAYASYPDGALWRSKVDGTERLKLSSPMMFVAEPQWSPDGKQIAFGAKSAPGKPFHIYTVSADGGALKECTQGQREELFPNWSLDGNSLIFGNWPSGLKESAPTAIHLLDLKTGQLTTFSDSAGTWYPRLSPNGTYIAALSKANHLALFDLKAQKWMELTQTIAYHPTWSHDGRYIYFDSTMEGEAALYRTQIKDHKTQRVASLTDVRRPASRSFASWTGLAPDDSPLALRDISTYQIYALDWQLP